MSWHMYIYIGLHELKTQQLVQLVIQILCMKFREILEEKILLLEYSCKERWRLRIDDGVLSLHLKSSKKKIKDIKIFAQKLQTKGRHMGKIHILQSYIKLSYSKPQTNNLICACKKSVCYSNLWQVYDCQKASISMHAEIQARERGDVESIFLRRRMPCTRPISEQTPWKIELPAFKSSVCLEIEQQQPRREDFDWAPSPSILSTTYACKLIKKAFDRSFYPNPGIASWKEALRHDHTRVPFMISIHVPDLSWTTTLLIDTPLFVLSHD